MEKYAIRRADGESWDGDYSFFVCNGPDDWMVAENCDFDRPTEIEIVELVPVAKRMFGQIEEDDE